MQFSTFKLPGRMLLFKTFFSALYAVLMFSAIACNAQPALLIGNANYMHVAKLANPTNDVAAFAEVLFQRGFDVQQVLDANKVEMDQAISDFLRKVAKGLRLKILSHTNFPSGLVLVIMLV